MTEFSAVETAACRQLATFALLEDLGDVGDITSLATIPASQMGRAVFVARKPGVLAGVQTGAIVAALVDPSVSFETHCADGTGLEPGTRIATVSGNMRSILAIERTALNFMQRLCGIATLTRTYLKLVEGLPTKILDTRKTTPGWRRLEKYAVRMGGGTNHRIGLFDGMLVKDNHLESIQAQSGAASPTDPILWKTLGDRIEAFRRTHPGLPVEIEVDSLDQLGLALALKPEIVLVDNFAVERLREAVKLRNRLAPATLLEASGGIARETLRSVAETGVERVSIGALTHSAIALDIGLDYV